jgi:hypothetical protein
MERGKEVIHFETEVIRKVADTETRKWKAVAKKAATKDIATDVLLQQRKRRNWA